MTIYMITDNVFTAAKPGTKLAPAVQRIPAKSKDGRGRPSYKATRARNVPDEASKVKNPSKLLITAIKAL